MLGRLHMCVCTVCMLSPAGVWLFRYRLREAVVVWFCVWFLWVIESPLGPRCEWRDTIQLSEHAQLEENTIHGQMDCLLNSEVAELFSCKPSYKSH